MCSRPRKRRLLDNRLINQPRKGLNLKQKMIATKEQIEELEKLARPLIKFLNDNFHPHVSITIDPCSAELQEGSCRIVTEDYIKD